MAFASEEIIAVLNKIKYPYNVGQPTQDYALKALDDAAQMKGQVKEILAERNIVSAALKDIPSVKHIYPSDANFILVKFEDANDTYRYLIEKKVVVRNRNNITLCEGCIRITIGTPEENRILIHALKEMQP
jgi:histidinol-phosphate aminotransferase